MRVSEIIKFYADFMEKHGDLELVTEEDDGRSHWVSPYVPMLVPTKDGWMIRQTPYGQVDG